MEEPVRLVPDPGMVLPKVDVQVSFEAFVEDHHARLFGAICLVMSPMRTGSPRRS